MEGLSLQRQPVSCWPPSLFTQDGTDDPVKDALATDESYGKEERQPLILVVDDAPDVLEMFDILLRLSGYAVKVATSAAEALEHARAMQFDIVVSDIGMPHMNGYELAQHLRALPGYKGVPMIAVTGFARYKDREQALGSGFDAHLSKPVNPITLLDLIEKLRE